ncbi:calcium-translocating P-type ATPase [Ramicandelaber brevisporus]|nr:calcium-translocating P-type ATPase [Ramicandelaber brevisporus]
MLANGSPRVRHFPIHSFPRSSLFLYWLKFKICITPTTIRRMHNPEPSISISTTTDPTLPLSHCHTHTYVPSLFRSGSFYTQIIKSSTPALSSPFDCVRGRNCCLVFTTRTRKLALPFVPPPPPSAIFSLFSFSLFEQASLTIPFLCFADFGQFVIPSPPQVHVHVLLPLCLFSLNMTKEKASLVPAADNSSAPVDAETAPGTAISTSARFPIPAATLAEMFDPKDVGKLRQVGGVEGIMEALGTSADRGLSTFADEPPPKKTATESSDRPQLRQRRTKTQQQQQQHSSETPQAEHISTPTAEYDEIRIAVPAVGNVPRVQIDETDPQQQQQGDHTQPPLPQQRKRSNTQGTQSGGAAGSLIRRITSLMSESSVPGFDKYSVFGERIEMYGENVLPQKPIKSIWQLMWNALQEKILILLMVAAIVSLALGIYEDVTRHNKDDPPINWVEGCAILIAVLIVVAVGSVNDYNKERQFQKLNSKKEDRNVKVIRDSRERMLSVYDVMVGDILLLEPGDILCADAVLISASNLRSDESSVTGETDPIRKRPLANLSSSNASNSLTIITSGLNHHQHHSEEDPFLISGSKILEGTGTCVVVAVGPNSFYGRTLLSLRVDSPDTPLQLKLNILAEKIAKLGGAAALLMFISLIIKYFVQYAKETPRPPANEVVSGVVQIVISTVTIVVVAVPEGLPLAVTLALSFATTRMIKDNCLVRVLASCETMGNATTICSDKTGTLTQNKMTVVAGTIGTQYRFARNLETREEAQRLDELFERSLQARPPIVSPTSAPQLSIADIRATNAALQAIGPPVSPIGNAPGFTLAEFPINDACSRMPPEIVQIIHQSIAVNSSSFEETSDDDNTTDADKKDGAKPGFVGSKTEVALLEWSRDQHADDYRAIRRSNPSAQVWPFSSEKKAMTTLIRHQRNENGQMVYRLFVKGAPEVILDDSTHVIDSDINGTNGRSPTIADSETDEASRRLSRVSSFSEREASVRVLDEASRSQLKRQIMRYSSKALRTLGLAYRDFTDLDVDALMNEHQDDADLYLRSEGLTWLGLFGIEDPLRDGVPEAVALCQKAGVQVRMVTGDNIMTAKAIAGQCGIYTPDNGGIAMTGPQFRQLTSDQMDVIIPRLQVLARSSPEDKKTLVEWLRSSGQVVAVTGDGTNDGPALKAADVGFSMGIAGTEVAKEAADIVLMDDDFSSIVRANMWGRAVNDSVKKFLQFQLAVNVAAVIIAFVSAISDTKEGPALTVVQLLFVNLIMDSLASLALATDSPTTALLERYAERKDAPIISFKMWKSIIGQGVFVIAITFTLLYAGPEIFDLDVSDRKGKDFKTHRTIVYNAFIWMQVFNMFNARVLDDSLNVFKGVLRNKIFIAILVIIVGLQIIIVFFGGAAFSTVPISGVHWVVCILLGALSLPVGACLRLIPDELIWWMLPTVSTDVYATPSPLAVPPPKDRIEQQLSWFKSLRGGRLSSLGLDRRRQQKQMAGSSLAAAMMPSMMLSSIAAPYQMHDAKASSVTDLLAGMSSPATELQELQGQSVEASTPSK